MTDEYETIEEANIAVAAKAENALPAFSATVPFVVSYPIRMSGKTYDVNSDIWKDDSILSLSGAVKKRSGRRNGLSFPDENSGGMIVAGENLTPHRQRKNEVRYALEQSWPVPEANCEPLHGYADADLIRIPAEVHYAKGADINKCSGSLELTNVLRNLDKCIPLSNYPPDIDIDVHAMMLERREGARSTFRHPTMDVEFPVLAIENYDEDYGYWPRLKDASIEARYTPFNTLIDRNDPSILSYYQALKVDLTKDYSAVWPQFPYACKDHPNRYFADTASHLRTLRPVWGMFGNDVLARGWNAFAQERIGDRLPSGFLGSNPWENRKTRERDFKPMKLNVFKDIKLPANSYPSWSWSVHSPEKNIALMMGRRGGDVFALDIDVTNRVVMGKILAILDREVGLSPFIRVGMWPKVALLYRVSDGEKIRSRALDFGKMDEADKSLGAIEILGDGKPLTAYGVHHSFLSTFQWIGTATPAEDGPEIAPEMSVADICRFVDAVSEEISYLPGYRNERAVVRNAQAGIRDGFMPKNGADKNVYVYDVNGIVIDGRSAYCRDVTYEITRKHRNEIIDAHSTEIPEIVERISGIVLNTLVATMLCDTGRWDIQALSSSIPADVQRLVDDASNRLFRKSDSGEIIRTPMQPIVIGDDGVAVTTTYGTEKAVYSEKLPRSEVFFGEGHVLDSDVVTIKRGDKDIALPSPEQTGEISQTLNAVVSNFVEQIYAPAGLGNVQPVVVVDAPTGAGKTSQTIQRIVLDPRTLDDHPYYDDRGELKMGRCPIVIAMPTYANIEEAISRAKILCMSPVLTDDELVGELLAQDCFPDADEARRRLSEVRGLIRSANRDPSLPPLDIQVYTGREQAGCPYRRHLAMLSAAHQPADRLCKAEIQKRNAKGEKIVETVYCPRYASCAYIAQKEAVKTAHIVFVPHAFVSNGGLPDCLKNARALIIDEQIHQQFLHVAFMKSEDFLISENIFPDWKMRDNISEAAIGKIQAHNERQAALRNTLPLREWMLFVMTEALRYDLDPATVISEMTTRFDMTHWTASAPVDDGESHDMPRSQGELSLRLRDCLVDYDETIHDGNPDYIDAREALHRTTELLGTLFKQDVRIKPELLNDQVMEKLTQPGVINAETEVAMWQAISERMSDIEYQAKRAIRRAETVEKDIERLQEQAEYAGGDDPRFDNWRSVAQNILKQWDEENPARIIHQKDSRFQFVTVRDIVDGSISLVEKIRFSWRTLPEWDTTPIMLLDASASPKIISRVFNERPVILRRIVEDAGSSLNMKIIGVTGHTFSNSSLVSSADSTIYGRVKASINMSNIRDALSVICGNYADSRVVLGASKSIREAILTGWQYKPDSLDSCHFGAMRGIDAYKKHSASVCVGRMEPPVEVIDAYAACLSWDDSVYEAPFNLYGNGFADAEGTRPLFQEKIGRRIRLRNGGEATIQTPVVPGVWGQMIQVQTREEEINQFIGRLRPVYRTVDERPVCYVISSIIPEHLILDDIISLYDIIGTDGRTNYVNMRKEGGGVSQEIMERQNRQLAMTSVLRVAMMDKNRLWPEKMVADYYDLLPVSYRTPEAIYSLLEGYGFHRDGRRDAENGFADGWAGIRFDGMDGLEHIWTPVAAHGDATTAIDFLNHSSLFDGSGLQGTSSILNTPRAVNCFTRERDSVDEIAETGYVMQKTARRGAMTAEEIDEAEYEASLHRKNIVKDFRENIHELMTDSFPILVDGRFVNMTPIYEVPSEGMEFQYYRLSPALIGAMVPGSLTSDVSFIREETIMARNRNLTLEQIYTLFAIQQIFGPKLEDIMADMRRLKLQNQVLHQDEITV